MGQLIKEGQEKGEIRKSNENHYLNPTSRKVEGLGISHKQSSTFQQIASIPEQG